MDFNNENTYPPEPSEPVQPSNPAVPEPIPYAAYPPTHEVSSKRKRSGWRVLWGLFTGMSVIANVMLVLMLMGAFLMVAAAPSRSGYQEEVIRSGAGDTKIAVVDLVGVIDGQLAQDVMEQLRIVRKDDNVVGIILRINSPGGGITASDEIYDQIRHLRKEDGIPVVAFMQSVAASGGYYAAVACDKIMAEPTTITGSIGVIMGHLVMQELLEEKLGIQPVVVKSGLKKDWPSSFKAPTDEQLQYLREKLIMPAYDRFLDVIVEGRKDVLNREEIKQLADGSIYYATEAEDEKLVDELGYFRDAISLCESLAGVVDARVVKFQEVFSLASLMQARSQPAISIDTKALLDWSTPEIMYLWRPF